MQRRDTRYCSDEAPSKKTLQHREGGKLARGTRGWQLWGIVPTVILVSCLCFILLTALSSCGADTRESLTDCEEAETGYVIRLEGSGLACEQASIIVGLIGAAEHGTQEIKESRGGVWACEAFPNRPGAIKYVCRRGPHHFSVRAAK